MSGMRMIREVDAGGESLPEKELRLAELLLRLGRNREAAAVFLQAATMTESAAARESLRRRSAELLSSRRIDRGRRLAC
jgi:predicted RNA polymerase sigma factor